MTKNHPFRGPTSEDKIDKMMHCAHLALKPLQSVSIMISSPLPNPAPVFIPSHILFDLISDLVPLCDSKFRLHSILERHLWNEKSFNFSAPPPHPVFVKYSNPSLPLGMPCSLSLREEGVRAFPAFPSTTPRHKRFLQIFVYRVETRKRVNGKSAAKPLYYRVRITPKRPKTA